MTMCADQELYQIAIYAIALVLLVVKRLVSQFVAAFGITVYVDTVHPMALT